MRKLLSFLLLNIGCAAAVAQPGDLPQQQKTLLALVAQKHIAPRPVDDAFSADFFRVFLNGLDHQRLFFTAADRTRLEAFRTGVDDEWKGGGTAFYTAAADVYKKALLKAKTAIESATAKPFDFSAAETFVANDTAAAATDAALAKRWHLRLKAETLRSLMAVAFDQWQTRKAVSKTEVLAKEPEARARVKARHLRQLNALLESDAAFHQELTTLYLNTFLTCHDPHSAFFDAAAAQSFKAQLATENLSFGFSLHENEKGEAVLDYLAPGGAAWASGLLNKGDVPVQLKWDGGTVVDLTGLEAEEIETLLSAPGKTKLTLTVRKGNGQQQSVALQKQKLEQEDNVVKSFVLTGNRNIGYVNLPSFYTQWEDAGGSRCAADVAREIVKLKKDSIAGLILDLRFNGGGSLAEAIEMAGIFVDEGAIGQVRRTGAKTETFKDMNRGVIYNGPLLVLVNGQSASASEVVAAALQDHNRAIIAGTPTFGKATGQGVLPLPDGSPGFAKLTMLKLFRPTGQTAQKGGVQPDVTIPDVYGFEEREGDEPFALSADTVAAYKYFKPLQPLSLAAVKQKSATRLAGSPKFAEGKKLAGLAAGYRAKGSYSLKWEDAEKEVKAAPSLNAEAFFAQPSAVYRVRNNTADKAYAQTANEFNALWLKRLAADMYVEEAFQLLTDFIQPH